MDESHSHQSTGHSRIWMVCFWSTFILAMIQALLVGLLIFGLRPSIFSDQNPFTLPLNRFAWFWLAPGYAIDFAIGALLAPFALYGFENARRGYGVWPTSLAFWLIGHVVLTLVNLWAIWFLWGAVVADALWGVLIVRIFIANIPIWLWLCGMAAFKTQSPVNLPES